MKSEAISCSVDELRVVTQVQSIQHGVPHICVVQTIGQHGRIQKSYTFTEQLEAQFFETRTSSGERSVDDCPTCTPRIWCRKLPLVGFPNFNFFKLMMTLM